MTKIAWPQYGVFTIRVVVAVGMQKGWTIEQIKTEIRDLYSMGRMSMTTGLVIEEGRLQSTILFHINH
jgi:hypothetical protein